MQREASVERTVSASQLLLDDEHDLGRIALGRWGGLSAEGRPRPAEPVPRESVGVQFVSITPYALAPAAVRTADCAPQSGKLWKSGRFPLARPLGGGVIIWSHGADLGANPAGDFQPGGASGTGHTHREAVAPCGGFEVRCAAGRRLPSSRGVLPPIAGGRAQLGPGD